METVFKINEILVSTAYKSDKMCITVFLIVSCLMFGKAYESFDLLEPNQCNATSYFDTLSHTCRDCGPMRIPSTNRLSCECRKGFLPTFNSSGRTDQCRRCEAVDLEEICAVVNLNCDVHDIKVLQTAGNRTAGRCVKCPYWSQPNADQSSCVPCVTLCRCPEGYEDLSGTCVKNGDFLNVPDVPSLYTFQYKGKYHASGYFRNRAKHIANKCKADGYSTSCEQLANLCALIDYNFDSITVCSLYRQLGSSMTLPSIYYDEGRNFELLDVERIPLAGEEELQFVVKQYGLDGTYKGIQPLTSIFSSKCCAGRWRTRTKMNANTRESCRLSPKDLMADRMHFYELFLVYASHSQANPNGAKLINVPIRVLNFVRAGFQRNKDGDIHRWQLTKRFFNVDVITGQNQDTTAIPNDTATGPIRYLSTLEIRISLVPSEGSPHLRIPYATVEYQILDKDHEKASIYFLIEYVVNMDGAIKSIEIALSVLSSVAAVYSVFRTWVWYRRSAKVTVELVTLIRFLIFAADILSNVIFLVVFLSTFYWLITFRQQHEVIVTLPKEGDEQFIKDLVISAFVLKAASVLAMIGDQCCVNVFMIDWENPRPAKADSPVSAWRMYFVANEWNEIQVIRKSGVSLQIVLVLLILKVLNFEVFALELPTSGFHTEEQSLRYNCLLRIALGVTTYLSIASLQILFNWLVYESYVKNKIQQLIDLCTMSNISLWLLVQERYGFYIHGRSPHGFSDTDMQTMCQQLQKEEDNLCAQRGLVQGQDGQTFTLSLHSNLIEAWSRLLVPSNSAVINATSLSTTSSGSKSTYDSLNKFLVSFLDHALREVDYEVRDRYFLEKVFNFEINQPVDRTIFYNDGSLAFDSVLFYGNEATLITFDVLLFTLVDIYCQSYLAAGITTFLIYKFLQFIRQRLGRRNLAKKTLIDARFLF